MGFLFREVILKKQLIGHRLDRSICAWYWDRAISRDNQALPVIASRMHYLFQFGRDGVTFLVRGQIKMPPLMAIEGMIAPPNIVNKVLSVVTGSSSNVSEKLPSSTTSCVPWRMTEQKYSNNEVYVDLVEEMDAVVNRHSYDEVQVNCPLSGIPDLILSFSNPNNPDDVRFHPYVRFRSWGFHQILTFVPPDGQFRPMSYRVRKLTSIPIYLKPQLTSEAGTCRLNLLISLRNDPGKVVEIITVQFQLPHCVSSVDLNSELWNGKHSFRRNVLLVHRPLS